MKLFLQFDGDNVGSSLELLLIDGNLEAARQLSELLKQAMEALRLALVQSHRARVHIFGGDDILASCDSRKFSSSDARALLDDFRAVSGLSISLGVGNTVPAALENLRRAKLLGKNRYVGPLA